MATRSRQAMRVSLFTCFLAVVLATAGAALYGFLREAGMIGEPPTAPIRYLGLLLSAVIVEIAAAVLILFFDLFGLKGRGLTGESQGGGPAVDSDHSLEAKVSFEAFMDALDDLSRKISEDPGFSPTVVVGVGRAGAVAGAILAGNLGEVLHVAVDRLHTYWDGARSTKDIVPEGSHLRRVVRNQSVLLVMAECSAGGTLRSAKNELLEKATGMQALRTACLFRLTTAEFTPDYIARNDCVAIPALPFRRKKWSRSSTGPNRESEARQLFREDYSKAITASVAKCVSIRASHGCADRLLEATLSNRRDSLQEPGCLCFDVLRSERDPDRFLVYEVFDSPASAEAHRQTRHYLRWKKVADSVSAEPRSSAVWTPVPPGPVADT